MTKPRGYRSTPRPAPQAPTAVAPVAPERYPPPSYAGTVWLTPEGLRLGLPATLGESGHTILLPLKPGSFEVMVSILRERARYADDRANRTIGSRAAPVQYDIEGILRAMGTSAPTVTRLNPTRTLSLDELTSALEDGTSNNVCLSG